MNIVYSTTVQWNPGDELILKGIRNLINIKHNFIVYNRHPLHKRVGGDNCYVYPKGHDIIDHIIFAGTPDWNSTDQNELYTTIAEDEVDFSYIGVGGGLNPGSPFVKMGQEKSEELFLSKAKIKIVRDKYAHGIMTGSILAPCPSLFGTLNKSKPRSRKDKIAFNLQGPGRICAPTDATLYKVGFLAKKFKEEHGASVVCHSYDDFVLATELGLDPFYSSDYLDYFDYYDKYDLIIGPRIHGSGWGSTLGIPSITIPHDERSDTAKHLGSEIVKVDDVIDYYDNLNDKWIKGKSEYLIELKADWYKKYIEMLDYLQ